jgi:4-amino-4-deoxy-L-arabinose transferase-like glycosyltransferase
MMTKNKILITNLLIVLFSALLFIPFLGNVHLFDWDEINFAESAREMIISGDYLNVSINYELFWEKPPLFIWIQVVSMKLFGINEFAARFPNAIVGILTLLFLFYIGRKHFSYKMGLIWVFAYVGSLLPHFYFRSGIIDPWFNFFIFSGIYFFMRYLIDDKRQTKIILLSALFIGLATLTKGPVALLVFLLSGFVYLLINKFKMRISFLDILAYIAVYAFVGGFWFILQIANGNYDIIYDFVVYQIELFNSDVAGHKGFLGYHFVVLLIGVFPASFFAVKSFKKDKSLTVHQKLFKQWMMILFWVVLILFSIVKTKIIHYSSLAYFPLTFLAAYAIIQTEKKIFKKSKTLSAFVVLTGAILAVGIISAQYFAANTEILIEKNIVTDQFAAAQLNAETSFSGFEFLIGVLLLPGLIFSFIYIKRNYLKGILSVFIITMLFTSLSLFFIVPEAEKVSQGALIEFLKSKKNHDAHFKMYAMKSYAHYFYGEVKPKDSEPAEYDYYYAVSRNKKEKEFLKRFSNYEKLYEKNGYVFYQKIE